MWSDPDHPDSQLAQATARNSPGKMEELSRPTRIVLTDNLPPQKELQEVTRGMYWMTSHFFLAVLDGKCCESQITPGISTGSPYASWYHRSNCDCRFWILSWRSHEYNSRHSLTAFANIWLFRACAPDCSGFSSKSCKYSRYWIPLGLIVGVMECVLRRPVNPMSSKNSLSPSCWPKINMEAK